MGKTNLFEAVKLDSERYMRVAAMTRETSSGVVKICDGNISGTAQRYAEQNSTYHIHGLCETHDDD